MKVLKSYRLNMKTLSKGRKVGRSPKKYVLVKQDRLDNAWINYERRIISIIDLHCICSSLVGKFTDELEYSILDLNTGIILALFVKNSITYKKNNFFLINKKIVFLIKRLAPYIRM